MFNGTLRRQLIISYTAVITLVLVVASLVMFVLLASSTRTRVIAQLQELTRMSRTTVNELREIRNEGRGSDFLEEIEETLRDTSVETNSRIYLVDTQGGVLFDSWGELAVGDSLSSSPLGENVTDSIVVEPNTRFVRSRDENGNSFLAIIQPLFSGRQPQRQNNQNVYMVHAVSEETPVQFFINLVLFPLLGISGLSIFVAGFFVWWISNSVTKPVRAAAAAAREMAAGNYDQRVEPQGPREVRTLIESFNLMAAQVSHTNQAQKDFVANVSHDLKTPLTSIQGWSQAILDGAAEMPQAREKAATIIFNESERMNRMVNQLLALAKLEAGRIEVEKEPLELTDLVRNVRRTLLFQAEEKGISLETDIQFESAVILADSDQITQVLTNFVQNALNHTPEGGRVLLRLRRDELGLVKLSVRDTGVGISPEDLERVFERFYQVDKSRTGVKRGTGLGLSIVQHITEAHGGTIAVKSEVGKGSEFSAIFPLYDAEQTL